MRRRGSSPKFQVHDNAPVTAQSDASFQEARQDSSRWGRLVESAIGMWLANATMGTTVSVYYWAAGDCEVDFVLAKGPKVIAVEVKSGRQGRIGGIDEFSSQFKVHRKLLVGADGVSVERFITTDVESWFG